ncbi:MAG: family 1 glycosylhydrolase [Firmicutes bacterium]|nr:family 1 glycosylhydrolase [Bacillota bacterium]
MSAWPHTWPPFLWGAATSSHQIEGHQDNDWTQWEAAGRAREPSGIALDHWNRWADDFAFLPLLGLNSYRFSLEWSRIEPQPGVVRREALDRYRAMLGWLRDHEILPLVTLHHFTLPVWVARAGGFFHPDAPAWFQRYVSTAVDALGDLIPFYITINEPLVLAVMGYVLGAWPPGERHLARALRLFERLSHLHEVAYRTIKERRAQAWVGLAHHLIAFHPWTSSPLDRFMAGVFRRVMNDRMVRRLASFQDFIGVNYYTRQYAHWRRGLNPIQHRPGTPLSSLGWELYPEGLREVLLPLGAFHKPILITENGVATTDDETRTRFLETHLQVIAEAQRTGIDIRGYFHWSLFDNFEWAEGFAPRFGLIGIDYATLARTVRPTAWRYRDIIAHNHNRWPITLP